jgi:hypothetical protein
MNPNVECCEHIDRGADIHGVAAQAVELGDNQNIIGFEPVDQAVEGRALHCRRTAGDGLGDDAGGLDGEAGAPDLGNLVLGRASERYGVLS